MGKVAKSDVARKRPDGETKQIVLGRIKAGWSNREIALDLGISTQAVHQHIQKLRAEGQLEEAS